MEHGIGERKENGHPKVPVFFEVDVALN